jgi:hypothetical protein
MIHAIREFIDWYCSEPRLAFNTTVVTRYRISLEQRHYAPSHPSATSLEDVCDRDIRMDLSAASQDDYPFRLANATR